MGIMAKKMETTAAEWGLGFIGFRDSGLGIRVKFGLRNRVAAIRNVS